LISANKNIKKDKRGWGSCISWSPRTISENRVFEEILRELDNKYRNAMISLLSFLIDFLLKDFKRVDNIIDSLLKSSLMDILQKKKIESS